MSLQQIFFIYMSHIHWSAIIHFIVLDNYTKTKQILQLGEFIRSNCMKELDFAFIGQRIKEVRNEKHLTQEYIANVTGVNVSHVSNIETNKVKISLTLLVNICNALNVTLDYLLENEYHNPTSITERELFNTIKNLDHSKLETLLRIAKVL